MTKLTSEQIWMRSCLLHLQWIHECLYQNNSRLLQQDKKKNNIEDFAQNQIKHTDLSEQLTRSTPKQCPKIELSFSVCRKTPKPETVLLPLVLL